MKKTKDYKEALTIDSIVGVYVQVEDDKRPVLTQILLSWYGGGTRVVIGNGLNEAAMHYIKSSKQAKEQIYNMLNTSSLYWI